MSVDKLEEIDIGDGDKPRPTFISANLDSSFREELIKLLKEYKDCFAWDYSKMPGLDRSIVEHRLPIKPGFKPYKQPPRKIYKDEVLADVKKEIERLIDANFIRPCRYAEWISNIVPICRDLSTKSCTRQQSLLSTQFSWKTTTQGYCHVPSSTVQPGASTSSCGPPSPG
jgi:hypothetical protein